MLDNPVQYPRVHQAGQHDEQDTHNYRGRGTEPAEGFLLVNNSADQQNAYCCQEHDIRTDFRENQDGKHS